MRSSTGVEVALRTALRQSPKSRLNLGGAADSRSPVWEGGSRESFVVFEAGNRTAVVGCEV